MNFTIKPNRHNKSAGTISFGSQQFAFSGNTPVSDPVYAAIINEYQTNGTTVGTVDIIVKAD
jgi:hypothetical protein